MSLHEQNIKQYSESRIRAGKIKQILFIVSLCFVLSLIIIDIVTTKKEKISNGRIENIRD